MACPICRSTVHNCRSLFVPCVTGSFRIFPVFSPACRANRLKAEKQHLPFRPSDERHHPVFREVVQNCPLLSSPPWNPPSQTPPSPSPPAPSPTSEPSPEPPRCGLLSREHTHSADWPTAPQKGGCECEGLMMWRSCSFRP